MKEWHRVVFSDESRFCLSSDSRRVRVWRRRGERYNPAAIVERPTVRQRGIMVWGAIAYDSRSPLLRIQGTMTAQRYVDDVLRPVTLPYLQGVPNALYQQDNARPHTARISQQALQDVQMLPWPPYSPDLSPIEHVWDIIGRRLHAFPQPRSEDELWQMVEREWRAIPQDPIRTLIDSLPRRVAACIALDAWMPEVLEAKLAAHWRIPNSLKPASKVTGCATEFNAHQRIPKQSQARLQSDRLRHRVQRASENPQQSQARLQSDRLRHRVQRASYVLSRLLQFVASNEPELANVPEHKEAYERILSKIDSNAGGLTAHSTFKLPLDLTRDEVPVCNLNADSAMGEILRQCKFIVWDECTMAHRHALEAVDITLKDCRQDQRPMGGMLSFRLITVVSQELAVMGFDVKRQWVTPRNEEGRISPHKMDKPKMWTRFRRV
ncbi:hypothetical protein LAZ67_X002128 [Cordylochernes scorpioides]|uniref:ATP-dependent DNA helicase n=1 Tax=Cordylochernes scorpioides TaxID=51811 RepID=A0ABY6LTK8_9ARAC|nr:hypothetical protein LAZ67_X002128 [Cordylochernes scorpioides]